MNPRAAEEPTLALEPALALVPLCDGNLLVGDLPALSLPFAVERRASPDRPVLMTHFDRARTAHHAALQPSAGAAPIVRAQFVAGFHYIDPSWIPRSPHAPTEVKAVFELRGRAALPRRDRDAALATLAAVTRQKQRLFAPNSPWRLESLDPAYADRLLPHIVEVEIEIEHFHLTRLMVLQHLSPEHREQVRRTLRSLDTPCARAATTLFSVVYG
jgi:predicted FMN-binding regulatory protein PaiB